MEMLLNSNHFFLQSAQDVKQICAPLERLHISHFSYTRAYKSGKRIYLTTDADILFDYLSNQFYLIGNCEHDPNSYTEQVLLWSSLPNQLMFNTAHVRGIIEGIFAIKPSCNYTDFFNFASHASGHQLINTYLTYVEQLKSFMDYFKKQAANIIRKAETMNIILPYQKKPFQLATKPSSIKLSKQQYECAIRLLNGKSNKQIAKELGLSPRTIETYIMNMKNKLRLVNRTELILKLAKMISRVD